MIDRNSPMRRYVAEALGTALLLATVVGLTQVAAAAQLGIPVATMKSRVQRGRAQLRESLEQCCAIDLEARGHVVDITPRGRCCAGTTQIG